MNQPVPPFLPPAAVRRSAVLHGVRHQRTARAALSILAARGIGMRVSRLSSVTGSVTQIHFAHGVTAGEWTDYHGFHQSRSHSVTIEALPLHRVPALLNAIPLPADIEQRRAECGEPEDFKGAAAQHLYTRCTGPMAATRWTPMPGHEDEEEPPRFTEACYISDGYVTLSDPGLDAVVKIELGNLSEFRARTLMEAYAALAV